MTGGAFSSGIAGPPPPLPSRKVMTFSRVALISGGMPGGSSGSREPGRATLAAVRLQHRPDLRRRR